jgi:hypothetical protein
MAFVWWVTTAAVTCPLLASLPACGGNNSREQARSYARGSVPCAADLDCCVVIDRCINQALVVGAKDKATVASLVAQPDPSGCTTCIPPTVQVQCVAGQCAGTLVNPASSLDGGVDVAVYQALAQDHCGSIAGVVTKTIAALPTLRTQAILGCGPK